MCLKIRDWHRFQHYKNGKKVPWVKLSRWILDSTDYHSTDPKAAKFLFPILLIATENEGEIPNEEILAFRLRISVRELQKILKELSWIIDVDKGKVDDSSAEEPKPPKVKSKLPSPTEQVELLVEAGVDRETAEMYVEIRKRKKAPLTKIAVKRLLTEVQKAGPSWTVQKAVEECIARGWQGFKAEYVAGRRINGNSDIPPEWRV